VRDRRRRGWLCLAGIAAVVLTSSFARADTPGTAKPTTPAPEPEPAWQKAPALRRSGFLVGLSLGLGLGKAAGYPNDAKKIGRQTYYSETDIGAGGGLTLWIGGALADWLTFGIGLSGGNITASDLASPATAFTFRTEVFPLFAGGGHLRDLGLALETGGGVATITTTKDTSTKLADSSGASRVGFGGFYEGIRLWKVSMGPFAGGEYMWSDTMRRGELVIGWRTALYAGAIAREAKPAKSPPRSSRR